MIAVPSDAHKFGMKFAARLKEIAQAEPNGEMQVFETGLAMIARADGARRVLGCPLCLDGVRGQTPQGYPTVAGEPLKRMEDAHPDAMKLPDEVRANMWLCPRCGLAQLSLLPRFDRSGL